MYTTQAHIFRHSPRENHKTREGENEFETDGRDAGEGRKGQERAAHSDEDYPEEVGRRQPILFLPGHQDICKETLRRATATTITTARGRNGGRDGGAARAQVCTTCALVCFLARASDLLISYSPDLSAQDVAQAFADYKSAAPVPRAQYYEERARKLGEHYGVDIEPSGWHATEGEVYRTEKPIRVRVHKDCHRCHTSFGLGSTCPSCSHHYCSKCGRDPPKRTDSQKQASRERREKGETAIQMQQELKPIIPHYGLGEPIVVTRPSRTGGQPLVHKVPRMRLRRSCHRCNTTFTQSTRVCENCGHRRCDDCPKTP